MKDLDELLLAALGRCQCTGECGATHTARRVGPGRRCGVPHGTKIVRLMEEPSFWQLATPDLAYPELYAPDVVRVELRPVEIGDERLLVCSRCEKGIARRGPAQKRSDPIKTGAPPKPATARKSERKGKTGK